ncbi:hypothetical protein NUW54_g123 [Trametes sanguinea]|uniref:Uncharacterized protein n=1 Tax=Trametes sanguinea TaxID=158606 RepID=A0ACC1QCU3_9APHY|nr:hypothetical protein NUW54_g123 [Trametes sanguinea]
MQQIHVNVHNPTLKEVLHGLQWGSYTGTKAVQSTNQKGVSNMEKRLFHSFQKVVPPPTSPTWPHHIGGAALGHAALVTSLTHYATHQKQVQHDVTMLVQVTQDQALSPLLSWEFPFLTVEIKTERALLNKTPWMEQIVGSQGGRLANRSNAEKLPKADRMLLQVWVQLTTSASPAGLLMGSNTVYYVEAQAGILYTDGPYYLPRSSLAQLPIFGPWTPSA